MIPLEIKTYPDPCLKIRTKPVEKFDNDFKELLRSMADMMYVGQGIGLAAPQVGLGLDFFVMDPGDGLLNVVNSEIVEVSKKRDRMEEGCLSLPGVTVSVARPAEVKIRAQDENGDYFIKKFEGLAAKVVQHEMDHLEGRLLIDYLDPIRRFIASRKLMKHRNNSVEKDCEVTCHVGKKDS
ncbi:MAG: peptide deformylase [Candidatus Tantalella remota]|nr:peptide deformylase [Candidatus Tantalella remota]